MFDSERRPSPQEKFTSTAEQQRMLWAAHGIINRIAETKFDPDQGSASTFAAATPEAVAKKGESGNLTMYDLNGEQLVEYCTTRPDGEMTSITHYLLNQQTNGAWSLQTTGDLLNADLTTVVFRGHELTDDYERLTRREPLYPELFEKATASETLDFINLVETALLGSTTHFFNEVDGFMQNITQIQQYADHLSGDTAFSRWRNKLTKK